MGGTPECCRTTKLIHQATQGRRGLGSHFRAGASCEAHCERTRLSGGFVGWPRCDVARDLLGQFFQLLAGSSLGGAQCGRVGLVPALLLAIGTHRFGVIRLPTIRQ